MRKREFVELSFFSSDCKQNFSSETVVFVGDVNGRVGENQYRICWCTSWIWLCH